MKEQHLDKASAIEKLKELVSQVKVCMMATVNTDLTVYSRPMQHADVDDEGNIWFFTNEHSGKIDTITKQHSVYLMYAHPGNNTYVHIAGEAAIITDKNLIKDKWSPVMKAWFPGGEGDPEIALLKIAITEASYWDGSNNKLVSFYKIAKALVTGSKFDGGEYGTLEI